MVQTKASALYELTYIDRNCGNKRRSCDVWIGEPMPEKPSASMTFHLNITTGRDNKTLNFNLILDYLGEYFGHTRIVHGAADNFSYTMELDFPSAEELIKTLRASEVLRLKKIH